MKTIILIMAPMYQGGSPSGGDNFFINLCVGDRSEIHVCFSGTEDCSYIGQSVVTHTPPKSLRGLIGFSRISDLLVLSVLAVGSVLRLRSILKSQQAIVTTCYVASDFFPDVVGGLCAKLLFQCRLVNCIFLMAPRLRTVKIRYVFRTVCYQLSQCLTHSIIRKSSDMLFFCSNVTKEIFFQRTKNKLPNILIHGGVEEPLNGRCNRSVSLQNFEYGPCAYASVYFARLHPQKGVLNAVKIWLYVSQVVPDARFAIIGEGPELAASHELAKALGIYEKIDWLGYVSREQLPNLVKRVKTMVHPVDYDTGGMAPIELTKYGVPMFCFEHPGMREMYGDLANYSPYPDVKILARKIIEVISDRARLSEMSKKSFELSKPFYWSRLRPYFIDELAKYDIIL